MEYYNPITELEWVYGTWEGKILIENKEQESQLVIRSIGSEIIEFNLTISKNGVKLQLEKNIFLKKSMRIIQVKVISKSLTFQLKVKINKQRF